MDEGQNNANQANGNSAGSQGIFSTPELTVDTTKISQPNTTNDKSRVASIFANTDAGQRSRKLNNAMGISSQPITEDLVIRNEPKKRSKVPIVVAILVLAMVAIGGGAYFIMQQIQNNPPETHASIEEAKQKFDEFATYVLLGKSENNLIGEYDRYTTYELDKQTEKEPRDTTFWNNANDLLSSAISSYESVLEKADVSLLSYLQSYQQDFKFLSTYDQIADPDTNQLIQSYSQSGADVAKEYVGNFYNNYLTDELSSLARSIIEYRAQQFTYYVDLVAAFDAQGCLLNNNLDDGCMSSKDDQTAMQQAAYAVDAAEMEMYENYKSLVNTLERSCWSISNRYTNPLNNQEEELE